MPKNHGFIPKDTERRQYLSLVMYALYHLESLEDVRDNCFMYNVYEQFVNDYSSERKQQTIDSIKWALEQDDIEACIDLPNLPRSSEFKRDYLAIELAHLEEALK